MAQKKGTIDGTTAQLNDPSDGIKKPPPKPPDRDPHTAVGDVLAAATRAVMVVARQPQTSSIAVKKGPRVLRQGDPVSPSPSQSEPLDWDTSTVVEGKLTTAEGGSSEHGIPKEIREDPVIQNLAHVVDLMGRTQFDEGRKWGFIVPYAAGQAGQVFIINMKDRLIKKMEKKMNASRFFPS